MEKHSYMVDFLSQVENKSSNYRIEYHHEMTREIKISTSKANKCDLIMAKHLLTNEFNNPFKSKKVLPIINLTEKCQRSEYLNTKWLTNLLNRQLIETNVDPNSIQTDPPNPPYPQPLN